jgi:hypothetical protein
MALSGSFTSSWQQRVLDALANNNVVDTALDGLKVGLFTGDPGESGSTANEVSGNGYARQALTFGAATNNSSNHAEVANTNALAFPASGGSWTGISHAGVFRTKSFTRSIRGRVNNPDIFTQLNIPASHMVLSATLTVTNARNKSVSGTNTTELTVNSNTAGTYSGTDHINNPIYFVRIKTGPLAGICYEIVDDGTNTIEIDHTAEMSAEDINGHQIEVRQKPTVQEFFGVVPASGGSGLTPGGLSCGSGSDADAIDLINGDGTTSEIIYPQNQPSFAGGDGWRSFGQATTDASSTCLPPVELSNYLDDSYDDYNIIRVGNNHQSDFTITSQLSTTDEMVARFQFETSGGTTTSHTVADGSQLDIAVGDLKLSLN